MSRTITEAHRMLFEALRALEAQMGHNATPWVPPMADAEQLGRLLHFALEPEDFVQVSAVRGGARPLQEPPRDVVAHRLQTYLRHRKA